MALCGLCGALGATVKRSNHFLPVTRPLFSTGERESRSVLAQGGDASAWPPFEVILGYTQREETGILKPWGELNAKIPPNEAARPFRTTGPDGRGDRGRSPRFT